MEDDRSLAAIYRASRPEHADDDVTGTLARMLADGRAAWPGVDVGDASYVRYVAERVPPGRPSRLVDVQAADLYIACGCAAGDPRAIAALDRCHLAILRATLERSGVERAVADEAVQRLRERLFVATSGRRPKIVDFGGRGPLAAWLRVAAIRAARDLRREEVTRASVAREAGSSAGLHFVDPELATVKRRYGACFNDAFRSAFGSLTAEERCVLRCYFVDGMNIERIGGALGISRATVGRRMVTARERLLAETLRLLGDSLKATPTELESLLAVVRSKLEVSLGALVEPLGYDEDRGRAQRSSAPGQGDRR